MKLFVANWKMHKTRGEARAYAAELGERIETGLPGHELVLAPPFTALSEARDAAGLAHRPREPGAAEVQALVAGLLVDAQRVLGAGRGEPAARREARLPIVRRPPEGSRARLTVGGSELSGPRPDRG